MFAKIRHMAAPCWISAKHLKFCQGEARNDIHSRTYRFSSDVAEKMFTDLSQGTLTEKKH